MGQPKLEALATTIGLGLFGRQVNRVHARLPCMEIGQVEASFVPHWTNASALPIHPVNQLLVQLGLPSSTSPGPDGVFLSLGVASPPTFIGDENQIKQQIEAFGSQLPVETVARVFLTPARLDELINMLTQAAAGLKAVSEAAPQTATQS